MQTARRSPPAALSTVGGRSGTQNVSGATATRGMRYGLAICLSMRTITTAITINRPAVNQSIKASQLTTMEAQKERATSGTAARSSQGCVHAYSAHSRSLSGNNCQAQRERFPGLMQLFGTGGNLFDGVQIAARQGMRPASLTQARSGRPIASNSGQRTTAAFVRRQVGVGFPAKVADPFLRSLPGRVERHRGM